MPWFSKYTKPMFLKPSTTCRAVSRLCPNDKEPKLAKSTIGIPEVSTLPLDTAASDLEATEGRNEALETTALAQDNILRECFEKSCYQGGRLVPECRNSRNQYSINNFLAHVPANPHMSAGSISSFRFLHSFKHVCLFVPHQRTRNKSVLESTS